MGFGESTVGVGFCLDSNTAQVDRENAEALTKELSGVSVARGLFVVRQPLIDDLAHGGVQTLQFLVLRCHG